MFWFQSGSVLMTLQDAIAYAMNDNFGRILAQKAEFYSNDKSADKIRAINQQIELVKAQMRENFGSPFPDHFLGRFTRLIVTFKRKWWNVERV